MKNDRVYEIRLTEQDSISIEQTQTKFMSEVFELANKSGLQGHGLEITLMTDDEVLVTELEKRGYVVMSQAECDDCC